MDEAGLPLPLIPWADLTYVRDLGRGYFGIVTEMMWRGTPVAVKHNGRDAEDSGALENELGLYARLARRPHPNVLPVYGACTDGPSGKVRLVMRLCEKGSLDTHLVGVAKWEVRCCPLPDSLGQLKHTP
jgi:hypothetical protein